MRKNFWAAGILLVVLLSASLPGYSLEKWNITWTDSTKNPLELSGAGDRSYMPYVLYNEQWPAESRYRIWFDYASIAGIGYAYSADGETWSTPVKTTGLNAEGSECAGRPVLLYNTAWGKPFRIYYYGNPGDGWQVRVAESADGIAFSNDQIAISTNGSELGTYPDGHAVVYIPGRLEPFLMYYRSANNYIMLATSIDGFNFLDLAPIDGTEALHPTCVISLGQNDYRMWAFRDNTAIQYLVSPNGINWFMQEDPVNGVGGLGASGAWNDQRNYYASVVYLGGGKFKMYRGGRNATNSLYRSGVADGYDPQLAAIKGNAWDGFSPLDDYAAEGWEPYTSNANTDVLLTQNTGGTVSVKDNNESGNFYMVRDVTWLVPFTVEANLRLDQAGGNDASGPHGTISLFINDEDNPVGESWQPSFGVDCFGGWNINSDPTAPADMTKFNTITIVCRFNEESLETVLNGNASVAAQVGEYDLYLNRDFTKPAVTFHGTNFAGWPEVDIDGRLDIGWPNPSTGTMTVDWVRWGSGVILDPKDPGTDVRQWELY